MPLQTLLDAHRIDPELLQGFPRRVKPRKERTRWEYDLLPLGFLLSLLPLLSTLHNAVAISFLSFLMFAVITVALLASDTERSRRKHKTEVLRYGMAAPAVIYDVHWVGEEIHVEYVCRTSFGEMETGVLKMDWHEVQKRDLKEGDTFTVIISWHDRRLYPYFYFSAYRISPIQATAVSSQVSASLKTQALLAPKQPFSSLGLIEPELLGPMPRRVEYLKQPQWLWWFSAGLATLATAYVLFPAIVKPFLNTYGMAFPAITCIYQFYWMLAGRSKIVGLERTGIPARAKVTYVGYSSGHSRPSPNEKVPITYQYEAQNGRVYTQTATVTRRMIWHYGITEGALFTVLYFAAFPAQAHPYFLLRNTRIIGATTVKVTPP